MAQRKITTFLLALVCLAAAGCAPVLYPVSSAQAQPGQRETAAGPADQNPHALVTITALVLTERTVTPSPTALPSATPTPSATPSPTNTSTLIPTSTHTPTATPQAVPPRDRLNYIALSNLDRLARLAVLAPDATGPASKFGAANNFGAFAFSFNGRWLAVAGGAGIRMWDLNAGQAAVMLSVGGASFAGPLAFHPGGRQVAAVDGSGLVRAWTLPAGSAPAPGPGFEPAQVDDILQIAYSMDGTRLVGLGRREEQGVLLLWESATGRLLLQKETGASVPAQPAPPGLLVSPNGVWIVQAAPEGVLRFWVPATGKSLGQQIIYACPDSLLGAAFSRDGAILALQCDGETDQIFLDAPNYFSPGDRRLAGVLEGAGRGPGMLSFNRDGALLAAAAGNPTREVRLWNLIRKHAARSLEGFGADIAQAAFSPDGKWLAVRLADGTVELWGVEK